MKCIYRRYCTYRQSEIFPFSTVKRISSDGDKLSRKPPLNLEAKFDKTPVTSSEYRENEVNIQMLSRSLHKQIFGSASIPSPDINDIERLVLNI